MSKRSAIASTTRTFARSWSRPRRLLAGAAAILALSSCKKEPIEIIDPENSEGGDFGRAELLAAVDAFRKDVTSPAAYRELADRVNALEPTFDKETRALSERMLAFLAIEPMSAHNDLAADKKLSVLAATVWPVALGPAPEQDEDGLAYLERVCGGELASECKFIVPEYWPLLIGAKVWRRFRFQAQETFAYCRACQEDDTYKNVLRRYDELAFPVETLAAERSGEGHPREWPRCKSTATPWKNDEIVTLEVSRGGELRLSGRKVAGKDWRDRLKASASQSEVGLYLRPDLSVARMRDYLNDLGSLGFSVARLQVRLPDYPYELRYYPLSTKRRKGVRLSVRGTDTIQVLVLAADQATKKRGEMTVLDAF